MCVCEREKERESMQSLLYQSSCLYLQTPKAEGEAEEAAAATATSEEPKPEGVYCIELYQCLWTYMYMTLCNYY